jgi:hypothetical protein
VELRGFEPRTVPAETAFDLRWLCVHVVTRVLCVLPICLGVLRDVTLLGGQIIEGDSSADPDGHRVRCSGGVGAGRVVVVGFGVSLYELVVGGADALEGDWVIAANQSVAVCLLTRC